MSYVNRKLYVAQELDPVTCLKQWRHYTREWLSILTPAEAVVVAAIMDRTTNWAKSAEIITTNQLATGIPGYSRGTGISPRQVIRILGMLEKKRILKREAHGQVFRYHLDFSQTYEMLNLPKKPKTKEEIGLNVAKTPDAHVRGGVTPMPGGGDTHVTQIGEIVKKPNIEASLAAREAHSDARTIVEGIQARDRRRTRAILSRPDTPLDVSSVFIIWSSALKETFPEASSVAWGIREKATVKGLIKKYKAGDGKSFGGWLRWVVENWRYVVALEFGWMERERPAPSYPDMMFLVRWYVNFLEWYNRRTEFSSDRAGFLDTYRRERLSKRGYTEEDVDRILSHTRKRSEAKRATPSASMQPGAKPQALRAKKIHARRPPPDTGQDEIFRFRE